MAVTFNTIPTKRLAATISGSSGYIKLNNILGWDGVNLTSADLGDVLYAVLRDQNNTIMEIMKLDPTTIANNSTTGVTILLRGLKFNGDLTTEVAGNKRVWVKNQTIVEIGTDVPQMFQSFVNVTGDQNVGGVKNFTSLPTSSLVPSSSTQLTTKSYVDSLVIAGGVDASTTVKGISKLSSTPNTSMGNIGVNSSIGTATMTIASPAVVTKTSHGLVLNDIIQFTTTGALPTGVTASTNYYVISTGLTADNFQFSATLGGAAVNTSGSQSGVHTLYKLFTISIGASATVYLTSHGFTAGDTIKFTTTGALPTGITVGTTYYVISTGLVTDSFQFSTSSGGSAVTTSGTQSGTHSITRTTPYAVGNEDTRLPTQAENDALVGANGTPSSTNRYLTELSLTTGDFIKNFGSGADGAATLDGTATVAWASKVGSVYTMTRDTNLTNLTINAGVTLEIAGYALFGNGTLSNSGTIQNNGGNGGNGAAAFTGGTAGTAAPGATFAAGTAGQIGGAGNGSGVGNPGIAGTNKTSIGSNGVAGGAGGTGGAGSAGGAGGGVGTNTAETINVNTIPSTTATTISVGDNTYTKSFKIVASTSTNLLLLSTSAGSGSGGGGGGNAGQQTGGGGGSGGTGGVVGIFFYTILNNASGTIQSNGGNGGRGGDGTNGGGGFGTGAGGGGGGGNGGTILLCYKSYTNNGTIQALGGTAGSGGTGGPGGSGAGANGTTGTAGTAGKIYRVLIS